MPTLHASRRRQRGFALGMVLVLLLALSAATAAAFIIYKQAGGVSGHMLRQRRNFYVCDGAARLIARAAQTYADGVASPNTTDMKAAVCSAGGSAGVTACAATPLPDFVPSGYTVASFSIESAGSPSDTLLDSGAYAGMSARVLPVKLNVEVTQDSSLEKCRVSQELSLATLPVLSFTVFGYDDIFFVPEHDLDVFGAVHANGDMCLAEGNSVTFNIEKATAGEGLYRHDNTSVCGLVRGTHAMGITSASGSFPSGVYQLRDGIGDKDHRDSGWTSYATTYFGDNAKDSNHGIKPLKLNGLESASVQPGLDAGSTVVDNTGSMRALLDPVLPTDTTAVKQLKLACRSDIRIINGVWFVRGPISASSPCGGWPGTAIWSDHPGRFTLDDSVEADEGKLVGSVAVGQYDLYSNLSWSSISGSPSIPKRYSYYRYDTSSSGDEGELEYDPTWPTPVVSYGTLMPASGTWVPGHWVQTSTAEDVCGTTHTSSTAGEMVPFDSTTGCGAGEAAGLLNSARSGFTDPEIYNESLDVTPGDRQARARVMPINIDIGALRSALKDTSTGELGAHLPSDFGGIVFITNTFTDSLSGFGSTTSFAGGDKVWPWQGDTSNSNDTNQPDRSASRQSDAGHPALPYPLCGAATGTPPLTAGDEMTSAPSGASPFEVPDCASYAEAGARPTVVRIFNAATVGDNTDITDPLKAGLTIVTPLPMYVLGEVNTTSDVTSSSGSPYVPLLLAADNIALLSRGWTDAATPWGDPGASMHNGSVMSSGQIARTATATIYNFAAITGMVPNASSAWGGGVDASMRLLENWSGVTLEWTGSLVVGFSPVYARWSHRHWARLPNWVWRHDPHLSGVPSQPPGAPTVQLTSTRAWRR